jgi:DNA-binding LytR/AlgR family response regulator
MERKIHIGARKHVTPSEILSFKADINYTIVIYKNGRRSDVVATTLKKIESRLQSFPHFFRISKNTIVNLNYVEKINEGEIKLTNGTVEKTSRRRRKGFDDLFGVIF